MTKKIIITSILAFFALFGLALPARASESVDARLSTATFLVGDVRTPFRAYEINGQLYSNIFEIAMAFTGSEKQFAPRWGTRQETLHITVGKPYNAIGFNMLRQSADLATATPLEISVTIGGTTSSIPAYSVVDDIFLSLRGIVEMLETHIIQNPSEYMPAPPPPQTSGEENPDNDAQGNNINVTEGESQSNTAAPPSVVNVSSRRIDPSRPMVAITFDDGPSQFTPPILDILQRHNALATFFIIGQHLENNEDILRRTFELGNEISNHTWTHPDFNLVSTDVVRTELEDTNNAIEAIIGSAPIHMRPPYGRQNDAAEVIIEELGFPMIRWSLDPRDWEHRDADIIADHVLNYVVDRDIILLHDLYESTVEATAIIVPALIKRGFQLVTVSELLYFSGITPEPGGVYRHGRE